MATVHKYSTATNALTDDLWLQMPRGAKVLSAINQREHLAIYAEVDPTQRLVPHRFRVAHTGERLELPVNAVFVGTVAFGGGELVVHVFDCGEKWS